MCKQLNCTWREFGYDQAREIASLMPDLDSDEDSITSLTSLVLEQAYPFMDEDDTERYVEIQCELGVIDFINEEFGTNIFGILEED